MADKNIKISIPDEVIMSKIYLIRGRKVMLDRDLSMTKISCGVQAGAGICALL
jgi:hypothetical protein